jgi:hypothetical protein
MGISNDNLFRGQVWSTALMALKMCMFISQMVIVCNSWLFPAVMLHSERKSTI